MSLLLKIVRLPFILWLVIGAGLAYNDYANWQSTTWAVLEGEQHGKEAQLAGLKKETAKAEDFRRRKEEKLHELQTLSAKIEATRQRYPTSPNIPQLLKDLADTADRTGLEFHSFEPQPEKRQEFVVITPIKVVLKGTYIQVMSFLDTAANLKRTVAAGNLKMDVDGAREGSVSALRVAAELVTYSIDESVSSTTPPPAPVTAPGAVAPPALATSAAPGANNPSAPARKGP